MYANTSLSVISEVIWQQDVSLAEKLFENYPLARKHIRINNPEDSKFVLQLVDPAGFSEDCNKSRTEVFKTDESGQ